MFTTDFRALLFAILGLVSVAYSATASEWKNPGSKYKDAYKVYADATCPIEADDISHFVYFARDRQKIRNHAFLKHDRFDGAQIMYSWRQLESRKGRYDFSDIRSDIEYLASHDKKLFIQLQDISFTKKYKAIPDYLLQSEYDGGVVPSKANGKIIGWVSKRWNSKVQLRYAALLQELGEEFDGKIEGINLQETAIDVSKKSDSAFSPSLYVTSIVKNMRALKASFPNSTTMQYANFMPGEWLPWEDEGYLREIYKTGQEIGVGLGAPDLMYKRKGQLNHPIAMMHEGDFTVPLGIAVQDGNYIGSTGADAHFKDRKDGSTVKKSIIPLLQAFAKDFLKVDYMFWVDQEPYFAKQVLPCFNDD